MKIKRIFQILLLIAVICPWNTLGDAEIWMESIAIDPPQPTENDIITFNISGWTNQSPSWVEYEEFSQDSTSLQLDLYVYKSYGDGFSEWTYPKQISALSADIYTLEINAFDYQDDILRDTYIFEFTVVPEPASLVLFGTGLCLIRVVSKRKKSIRP